MENFELYLSEDNSDKNNSNKNSTEDASVPASIDINTRNDDTILDADELDEEPNEPAKPEVKSSRRGPNKEYIEILRFNNYKSAKEALDGEIDGQRWTKRYTKDTEEGEKTYFTCLNYQKCPKTLYMLKHSDSLDVSYWICSNKEHEHFKNKERGRLPIETVNLVKDCLDDGISKNLLIIRKLRKNQLPEIKKSQLNNLKMRLKEKVLGANSGKISDLKNWCSERMEIPDDDDEVFCGAFDYKLDDEQDSIEYLRIFITTKRLISYTEKSSLLVTDGTYKLNYNNYPILVCGTVDLAKQFHPFGLLITKNETATDFSFMFQSIRNLSNQITKKEYKPRYLLADSAASITLGFKEVFNLEKRIHCWTHVLRAIDKELNKIKNKSVQNKLRADIVNFHHYVEERHFFIVARLMVKKWKAMNAEIDDFIDYFQKQWCSPKRFGWFDHYCDWTPITNNALESTNRYIKDTGTLRKRMSLNQFLNILEDGFVKDWSLERDPLNINYKKFETLPVIKLRDHTVACQWNKLNKVVKQISYKGQMLYCTSASDKVTQLKTSDCQLYFEEFEKAEWTTYDKYLDFATNRIRYVTINSSQWQLSKCSCSQWCKNYLCKHMLGICERLEKFDFPPEARDVPIGCNRRRGRPKITTEALKYQPDELQDEEVYSDYEPEESDIQTKKRGRKRKPAIEKENDSDSDFDLFDDEKVKKATKLLRIDNATSKDLNDKSANKKKNKGLSNKKASGFVSRKKN